MTFITYLEKGNWIIRVSGHDGKYTLEFTDDIWDSKTIKYYDSLDDLLQVLNHRFSEEELELIIKFESDSL